MSDQPTEGTPETYWRTERIDSFRLENACDCDDFCDVTRILYTRAEREEGEKVTLRVKQDGDETHIWTPETSWLSVNNTNALKLHFASFDLSKARAGMREACEVNHKDSSRNDQDENEEGTPVKYWKLVRWTFHDTVDCQKTVEIEYTPQEVEDANETIVRVKKLGDQTFIWTPETKWKEADSSGAVYYKKTTTHSY